jgi:hypothetical protein
VEIAFFRQFCTGSLAFMVPIRHDGAGESEEMSSKMEITITPPGWISYIGAMLGSVLALY